MSERIFVGNLPFSATNTQLNELFGKHGEVTSAEIVMDRFTDRSRGFGFVEMVKKEEATTAIAAMSGQEMDGRALTVAEAKPRTEGGSGARTVRASQGHRSAGTPSYGASTRW